MFLSGLNIFSGDISNPTEYEIVIRKGNNWIDIELIKSSPIKFDKFISSLVPKKLFQFF